VTRAVFLDASAWFGALSPRDQWHDVAKKAYLAAAHGGYAFVTTTLVVAEVHALVLRGRNAATGRRFLAAALHAPSVLVLGVDLALARDAVREWIDGYEDQPFSFCDAVSFEVMRREGITHALAFDRHFKSAGFQLLT
jgi:predicted nucleic acid-binding protein